VPVLPFSTVLVRDTTPLPRRRRLPSLLLVALFVSVAGAAGILIASKRAVEAVPRVSKVSSVLSRTSASIDNDLLVGSDSRSGGDPNTGQSGGVTGSRSDTIMVLRYDKATGTASLLSIPRDLWVTVPGHSSKRRINAAFNDGPDVLVRTVQTELGIPVHHFVEIDFTGFERLVNALGGITICFPYPTKDLNTGLDVGRAGCHHLNGEQALAYARSRHYQEFKNGAWHTDPTSDLGRSRRQRDFVNRCLQSAVAQVKADPFRAGELITAMSAGLRIDDALNPLDAAASLRSAVDGGLKAYSLPVLNRTIEGNAVLELGPGADRVLAYFRGVGGPPPPVS
jgi:LCP family protein required for cell wall assembly